MKLGLKDKFANLWIWKSCILYTAGFCLTLSENRPLNILNTVFYNFFEVRSSFYGNIIILAGRNDNFSKCVYQQDNIYLDFLKPFKSNQHCRKLSGIVN